MRTNKPQPLLQRLLNPLDKQIFLDEYYEKKHCHIQRKPSDNYDEILTIDDINEVLQSGKIDQKNIKIVSQARLIHPILYTKKETSKVDPKKIIEYFKKGHSIILDNLQNWESKLRRFVQGFEAENLVYAWVNIYITPSASQAFKKHYDYHDVFILQLNGSKYWKLYDVAVELPDGKFPLVDIPAELKPKHELILNKGDLLYIPRGMVHKAWATDEHSIHITLGVIAPKMLDILECIKEESINDVFFRTSIQAALAEHENIEALEQVFKNKLLEVIDKKSFQYFIQKAEKNYKEKHTDKPAKQQVQNTIKNIGITENTTVMPRRDAVFKNYLSGILYVVEVDGEKHQFPLPVKPMLEQIFKANRIQIKYIYSQAPLDYKIAAIEKLLAKSIIEIAE